MTFRLAPMSTPIRGLTVVPPALPLAFLVPAPRGTPLLLGPAAFVVAMYAGIWLRYRPTAFVVHPRTGWGVRVGTGGLFGAFGDLRTADRGLERMYISRTGEIDIVRKAGNP